MSDEQIAAADVIIGNLAPARLKAAQNLRLFQLNSAGYDKYAAPGIVPEGAIMACATGAYGQSVSEHMFAMVLAMMKRLPAYRDCQREHDWRDLGPVTTFVDAQVLVLGAGDIGTHFATLASAMGAHVTGMRRSAVEPRAPYERMATMDALYEELGRADIVFSILPSCDATRGLANEKFFAACQPGALFANGGRGDLVVASDLIAALESGHIAGAALDVTSPMTPCGMRPTVLSPRMSPAGTTCRSRSKTSSTSPSRTCITLLLTNPSATPSRCRESSKHVPISSQKERAPRHVVRGALLAY